MPGSASRTEHPPAYQSAAGFCAAELEAVGRGLEELRLDELVTHLERGAA